MKVKTYRAATLREALAKVKRELGPDAFILGQREIRPSNLLGLVQKNRVEVTAAIEPSTAVAQTNRDSGKRQSVDSITDRIRISQDSALPSATEPSTENGEVLDEIRRLNVAIRSISAERQAPVVWLKSRKYPTAAAKQLCADLVANGINEELANSLVSDGKASPNAIVATLAERVRIYSDLIPPAAPDRAHVVAFLGPTGVGKTTTIAKVTALAALDRNLTVGLITLDNFRIAAIEQLKTYGDIMGIAVHAVSGTGELASAIQSLSDRDLILIDTAGRSHREISQEWELASFLNASTEIKKALVVSATTRETDLASAVDQYGIFNPDCLIFTKLDETGARGTVINELLRCDKPLAYVTVGQGVPHDIVQPDARQLVEFTVGPRREELWTKLIHATRQSQIPRPVSKANKTIRRHAH